MPLVPSPGDVGYAGILNINVHLAIQAFLAQLGLVGNCCRQSNIVKVVQEVVERILVALLCDGLVK